MNEKEYQQIELQRFSNQQGFFDSPRDFSEDTPADPDWLKTQLEWIENGSYGAGAMIALRKAYEWAEASHRANKRAAVGNILIHALYGQPLKWRKITPDLQDAMNQAVDQWREQERNWAAELAI